MRRIIVCTVAAMGAVFALASPPATHAVAEGTPVPEPGVCSGCKPPLTYHGGPVMGTSGLTITPIYWAPPGYEFPADYVSLVNQYISDVAAASGKTDNVYAIAAEYYQVSGSTQTPLTYKITAGAPITDNTAFPATAAPCSIKDPYTACVTREQLRAELVSVLAANSLTADLNHFYALMFPPKVQTLEGNARSGDVYCGIHGAYDLSGGAGTVVYADEPFLTTGCGAGQSPNNNLAGDTQLGTLSHEIVEAMTDPTTPAGPAWFDSTGNEIGDECSYNYGPPLGSADPSNPQTTQYNQVINGHNYYTQTMFSNAAYAALGQGKGCIGGAHGNAAPAAATVAAASTTASATLDAGSTELPADGSSTTPVTVTIVDGSGAPLAGDHVHIDVRSKAETPGACGTVDKSDGVTDQNGQFMVTYKASSEEVACFVMAIDAESGSSDAATIYQGSSSKYRPTITANSMPTSLAPGGPADTFSVTATNNSKIDISDARFDVFLTGDNNGVKGDKGLKAGQVHLSYHDDSSGTFVDVPLTGETLKDGEIAAYLVLDKNANLPAGGTRTLTFQISLDAGAPTSAQTGTPLSIETDLDQFNPADETQYNLDYVQPADVSVGGSASSASSSSSGPPIALIIGIVAGVLVIAAGVVLVTRRRGGRPGGPAPTTPRAT